MTGPHQLIICCFTGTGQGAAAWTATCSDETSYRARSSSGSLSMRTNMVGTNWPKVTWCSSIRRSVSAGSKWSMTTTVPPARCTCRQKRSGAAWYSGAGERYTVSGLAPNSPATNMYSASGVPNGTSRNGTFTPLGRPVVPEEYSMSMPSSAPSRSSDRLGRDRVEERCVALQLAVEQEAVLDPGVVATISLAASAL